MLPMLLFHSRVTPIFMGRSSAGRFPTPVEPSFILIAPPSWPPQARGVIARLATETSHTEELLWDPQECVAAPETTNSKYFTCAFILSQAHGDTRGYSPPYGRFGIIPRCVLHRGCHAGRDVLSYIVGRKIAQMLG